MIHFELPDTPPTVSPVLGTTQRAAKHRWRLATTLLYALTSVVAAWSQGVDVSLKINLIRQSQNHSPQASGNVVVWLTPTQKYPPRPRSFQQYTLVQKNKQFYPHVLVVPTGSSVDFPNRDPFFHNVFSLFNGKRFDLGLYEGRTHRAIQFDREGISYIFCNIHPEMGAVIIAVNTPYYALSAADGSVVIHDVPPGDYRLNVWAENVASDALNALSRTVILNQRNAQLGTLHLTAGEDVMTHHKNKFGENYPVEHTDPY